MFNFWNAANRGLEKKSFPDKIIDQRLSRLQLQEQISTPSSTVQEDSQNLSMEQDISWKGWQHPFNYAFQEKISDDRFSIKFGTTYGTHLIVLESLVSLPPLTLGSPYLVTISPDLNPTPNCLFSFVVDCQKLKLLSHGTQNDKLISYLEIEFGVNYGLSSCGYFLFSRSGIRKIVINNVGNDQHFFTLGKKYLVQFLTTEAIYRDR